MYVCVVVFLPLSALFPPLACLIAPWIMCAPTEVGVHWARNLSMLPFCQVPFPTISPWHVLRTPQRECKSDGQTGDHGNTPPLLATAVCSTLGEGEPHRGLGEGRLDGVHCDPPATPRSTTSACVTRGGEGARRVTATGADGSVTEELFVLICCFAASAVQRAGSATSVSLSGRGGVYYHASK